MRMIGTWVALALFSPAGGAAAQEPARTIEGRLDRGDPRVDGFAHFDEHRIRVPEGQRLAITVISDAFDPVVELYRAGETFSFGRNDDDGTSLHSRYVLSAPRAGDYVVRVTSFGEDQLGPYTLGLTPLPPLPAPVREPSGTETSTWRVFQGEIAAGDGEAQGRRFDDYLIPLRQGELAIIRADSAAIDPLVEVMAAAERDGPAMATDDDSGPGLGALLAFEAPIDGDYIVRVHSLDPQGTGAYTLRIGR